MIAPRLLAASLLCALLLPHQAVAASVSRTYSYFRVHGATLPELQEELSASGPQVRSTGQRHAGATEMQFTNRLSYARVGRKCGVSKVDVSVRAKIILPRWTRPGSAQEDTRLVWGALAGDIKRHEESHVSIARSYARQMEDAVRGLPPQRTCEIAATKANETIRRLLGLHDAEQERFDRIERINFSDRMDRLIRYRIQQIESGRIRN